MNAVKKILIIEDDPSISSILGEAIGEMGYEIDFAYNGKEGIDNLISNALPLPDLILLDLFLPVMNGAEFRKRQLQIPWLAKIPVVAMSADCCVKQRCGPLHLKHYLKKPFQLDELIQLIEDLTKHSVAADAAAVPYDQRI
ncbi:MAG: response regulator [Bdellovibrionales bacterium]|nr:response regulator [Bdellovibrionales bacterium]